MWENLRSWWRQLCLRSDSSGPARRDDDRARHRVAVFESRGEAQSAAREPRVVALFYASGSPKWAYFMCPCGCGQQLALNLMPSHRPVWRVSIRSDTDFSIFPSVDSTICGAHFWLRGGSITWAE